MAEFECGYCTGCGVNVRRWGHRPYCWRQVSMALDIDPSNELKRSCLDLMQRHWRIRALFLVRKQHMYYQPGDLPPWKSVDQSSLMVTEIEQDGNEVLTHLSDGRCAVNQLSERDT